MPSQRPPAAEPLGAADEPRAAACVILLREVRQRWEVLLVRRHPAAPVVGGAWVFPGGTLAPADGDADREAARRAAARRELAEEVAITLSDPAVLVPFSRWITPRGLAVRFDTTFFVAEAPALARPRPDGRECIAARWVAPRAALASARRRELALVFPTVRQLECLATFPSIGALFEHARRHPVVVVQPRLRVHQDVSEVVLPGEPGYEALD